ncbi:hypothetical protein EDI28_01140 [Photobacterium chitinilyticum]|uniref:Uncharacterized protein n=1 Tax=Photobacterium chitinilyticum TaxID=2485123 RepID=A0A3S3RAY3_9GAMM|nr:hypothetical protein EDI28_01140 [Photobacterium chitinilyticum]
MLRKCDLGCGEKDKSQIRNIISLLDLLAKCKAFQCVKISEKQFYSAQNGFLCELSFMRCFFRLAERILKSGEKYKIVTHCQIIAIAAFFESEIKTPDLS